MTDINYDYDTLVEELNTKVEEAIGALKEAKKIADKIHRNEEHDGFNLKSFDTWDDLKNAIDPFFNDISYGIGWESSSWCSGG